MEKIDLLPGGQRGQKGSGKVKIKKLLTYWGKLVNIFKKKIRSADDPKLDEAFNKGLITESEQLRLKYERSKERYADYLKKEKKKK